MSLNNINVSVVLTEVNCGVCAGTYAISDRYREQMRKIGGSWTCPYCQTGWGYAGNSENERLKRQVAAEKKKREWAEQETRIEKNRTATTKRSLSAHKAVNTRMRNRAKAGVCPCCNRTFKQLAAHMKNKHPEFGGKH